MALAQQTGFLPVGLLQPDILPTGFEPPALPYLVVVAAAVLVVGWLLVREDPPVTERTVLAFAPWMALGSALYVGFQLQQYPDAVAPFFGSPIVYATTFALAGVVWLALRQIPAVGRPLPALAATGGVLALVPTALAVQYGLEHDSLTLVEPLAGVVVAVALAAVAWRLLGRLAPEETTIVGAAGALAVFGHVLDAVSTTVGVDLLGFGEQTPLSAAIMHFAAALPTEPYLGVGWLFVLVKTVLACGVVVLLAEYVREEPSEGNLVLAFVTAVGLGPGAHNILLFIAANPTGL
ncbi:DUF63 family protein [Halobacterium zhouii]|uniref:DUF63 family protein n=1 Tax=Halobacterium zhouii TaxID=2902624 RepID=UPI001E590AA1|nr:DUF63 family protein [Halobacterium zhouii]